MLAGLAASLPFASAIVAFPGAEGFGANAIGGRAGEVFVVTNLNDAGAGSLRDGLSKPNRVITFAVGGTIKLESRLVCPKSTTILGQTAPGDGIATYGDGWSFSNADESIVRYVRIRMGKGGTSGKDAATLAEGSNMVCIAVSKSSTCANGIRSSITSPSLGAETRRSLSVGQLPTSQSRTASSVRVSRHILVAG